jgi:DUF917 family protein
VWQHPAVQLSLDTLDDHARGCAILGTGGGGDTYASVLAARAALAEFGPVDVLALDRLDADALILPVSGWGAPTVGIEKLPSGEEGATLVRMAERWYGRAVDALMIGEIGGGNGVEPVGWAARLGLPLVDADGMGRAFPEGDMASMHVAGVSASPAFFADERGNGVVASPQDAQWLERIARALVVAFGGAVAGADHPMDAATARRATVLGSVTLATSIGAALRTAGLDGVLDVTGGTRLVSGTVTDVDRRTAGGFARGTVTVEGTGDDASRGVIVHVQNENLLAEEAGAPLAMVPDLITICDEGSNEAIPTERIRYGQRVVVIGIPCDPVWRTTDGLRIVGPARFGFDHGYRPIEELAR